VEGSCEYGNEPSGSLNCSEILQLAKRLSASREGLNSIELVSYAVRVYHHRTAEMYVNNQLK
jgi:hypothetical protein